MENFTAQDLEEMRLKERVLNQNSTFKTAFKATMGFYAAQFVATLLGLTVLGIVLFVGVGIYILATR